jgi:hypothetical protein
MATATATKRQDDTAKAEFERVMKYVTEQAWTHCIEQEVMAALFDVLHGEQPEDEC